MDAQCVQSTSSLRGIGRYALSLTRALVATAGEHRVELLLNGGDDPDRLMRARRALETFLPPGRIHVFNAAWPWTPPYDDRRRPAAEAAYAAAVRALRPDVLLVASPFEGDGENVLSLGSTPEDPPTAAVLYDLIPALEPHVYLMGPGAGVYWRRFEQVKRCAALLSISAHSGRQATQLFGADCPPITPVWGGAYPSGAFPSFEPHSDDRPDKVLPARFLLSVGGDHPRKNLDRLVAAWGLVSPALRAACPLVLACRLNPGTVRRLRRLARRARIGPDQLVLTGGVSEPTLARLYATADAFVFPSLEEGLGMPPLEAMAAGCPTVLAHGSSLDELCDEPDAFFDGLSTDAIAAALLRVLSEETFRTNLRSAGVRATERFTWEHSAQRAWSALAEVAQTAPRPPGMSFTPPARLSARLVAPAPDPGPVLVDVPLPAGVLGASGLPVDARVRLADATALVFPNTATASRAACAGLLDMPLLVGTAGLVDVRTHDFYAEYAVGLRAQPPPEALVPALVQAVQTAPRWMLERPRTTWLALSPEPVEPALVRAVADLGVDLVVASLAGVGLAVLVDAVLIATEHVTPLLPALAAARRHGARVITVGTRGTTDVPAWCEQTLLITELTTLTGWQGNLPTAVGRWGRTTGWPWRDQD
ncbi:MAG: hypothetical protein NVS3B26_11530 [Mycobacteriales bacterium]